MNERIRELAQAAEQLADDELAHLERVHNRLYSFTEGREIYNQKFAELIVAECCKEIMYASVGNEDPVFAYSYTTHLNNTFGDKNA
jgi:hypothetical protein